jgi:hypothetical protein
MPFTSTDDQLGIGACVRQGGNERSNTLVDFSVAALRGVGGCMQLTAPDGN